MSSDYNSCLRSHTYKRKEDAFRISRDGENRESRLGKTVRCQILVLKTVRIRQKIWPLNTATIPLPFDITFILSFLCCYRQILFSFSFRIITELELLSNAPSRKRRIIIDGFISAVRRQRHNPVQQNTSIKARKRLPGETKIPGRFSRNRDQRGGGRIPHCYCQR